MTQALALRPPETDVQIEMEDQHLQLLVQWESVYRAFFRNFLDFVLRREEPPLLLESQPIELRRHFYVRTGVRWIVVVQSVAWQFAALPWALVLGAWFSNWEAHQFPSLQGRARSHEQVTYYAPVESFPAREGRQSVEPAVRGHNATHLTEEKQAAGVEAPKVKFGNSARVEIAGANPVLPAVPLSATQRSRLVLPGDLREVIGPVPEVNQLSMRAVAGGAASVVAPPPQVAGLGRRRVEISVRAAAVVAPAPAVAGAVRAQTIGSVDIGSAAVVPPSPQLPMQVQHTNSAHGIGGGSLAASGVPVVPPAPSVRGHIFLPGGSGNFGGATGTRVAPPAPAIETGLVLAGGSGNSLEGAGAQVVAPAPSLAHGLVLAGGGGNSLSGDGNQVVPPAPAVGNAGVFGRDGGVRSFASVRGFTGAVPPSPSMGGLSVRGGGGTGSLSNGGAQVVAPVPSIAASGVGLGEVGGRGNTLGGFGSQVLPPSGAGSGGSGQGVGGGNSASGTGSQGSAGSGQSISAGSGGSGATPTSAAGTKTVAGLTSALRADDVIQGGKSIGAPIIRSAIPPHSQIADVPAGQTQVLPLRVVQLATALPTSSYFSNYEAFVAERSINRDTTQLIKLVYIFLPYQRRLTEFGVSTSKTFNLKVTRDPSCDESLMSMTWPEGEDHRQPQSEKDKLPCYRTTADDYRKAWEKSH